MVAAGLMTQLVLKSVTRRRRGWRNFAVPLDFPPTWATSASVSSQKDDLAAVMASALQMWFLAYEPFPVTSESMIAAAIEADQIGREMVRRVGDEAYRSVHAV